MGQVLHASLFPEVGRFGFEMPSSGQTNDWLTQPENWHEAAKLFPLLPDEELNDLAEDIKENGLLNPIMLFEGKVLDGRNRALACKKVGSAISTNEWQSNGTSPVAWVISQNLHRRHLTASQKAVVAYELEPLFAKKAKKRQKQHGGTAPGRSRNTSPENGGSIGESQKLAAKSVGVSHGYVAELKKIVAKDPSLLPQIKAGKLTIPEAQKKLGFRQSTAAMVSAESNEWYSPKIYIDAARKVLGEIELDPASCVKANRVVKAKWYFSKEDDGLAQEWKKQVWLNPPYGDVGPKFVAKLIRDYESGRVKEAILLVNSHCTDTKWFQPLFGCLMCFTDHRSKFWNAETTSSTSPTHGSVLVYFGKNPRKFEKHFKQFGAVLHRYKA
jgi:ParB family chromosome partitioning protein